MSTLKMYQFNDRFERLYDQCMEEVKMALMQAKSQNEKHEILQLYGFWVDDFNHYVFRKTDETMILSDVDAHLQRSADFVGKSRQNIYNHTR